MVSTDIQSWLVCKSTSSGAEAIVDGASATTMPQLAGRVPAERGDGILWSRMAQDLPRVVAAVVAVTLLGCIAACAAPGGARPGVAAPDAARARMVEARRAGRGITDPRVLHASRTVLRE